MPATLSWLGGEEEEQEEGGSCRVVLPWVVGVNKVDELVVPLVAAAVHARHDLSPSPAGKVGEVKQRRDAATTRGTWS